MVDVDNDGLIEINYLEDLDYIRHDYIYHDPTGYNLVGTRRKPGADAPAMTYGAPTSATANCANDEDKNGVYLCGYELARSLDFNDPHQLPQHGQQGQLDNGHWLDSDWRQQW